MRRSPLFATAAAVVLLSLGACAGGGKGASSKSDMHDTLSAHFESDGFSKEQAGCYPDLVIDEVGLDALKKTKVGDDEPPTDQQAAYAKAALRAVDECDIDAATING